MIFAAQKKNEPMMLVCMSVYIKAYNQVNAITDWWLELIIDVIAKIEFVAKVEWQTLQINQTHD